MILDTTAVSDFFEGNAAVTAILGKASAIHLPVIVLGEYRYGLLGSKRQKTITPRLDALAAASQILVVDEETTNYYAAIAHELKKVGQPIPLNDLWIAALARQHALPVLTRDAHFDRVPGLHRITW